MRNLKKVLSLALALVMLLGMMVVGAGAATDYTDADQISNLQAAEVADALGIIEGNAGQFMPTTELDRAQAAQIIARMMLTPEVASTLKATGNEFSDTQGHWAAAAINYCAQNGIVEGNGAGSFFPDTKVTGYQFAKMLLVALGYDAAIEGYNGSGWKTSVAIDALRAGLTQNVQVSDAILTRDAAVQMVLNCLTADVMEYTLKSEGFGLIGTMSNTKTNYRTSVGNVTGNSSTPAGNDKGANTMQFCELHFPQLKLIEGDEATYGNIVACWKIVKGNTTETISETPVAYARQYTELVTAGQIYKDLGMTGSHPSNWYIDGVKQNDITLYSSVDRTLVGGQGAVTTVWTDDKGDAARITVVNTYVGDVAGVQTNGAVTISPRLAGETVGNINGVTGLAVGDVVLYTKDHNIIVTAEKTTPVTGTLTAFTDRTDSGAEGNGRVVTVNGSATLGTETAQYSEKVANVATSSSLSQTVTAVKDNYGNIIYVSSYSAPASYAYVVKHATDTFGRYMAIVVDQNGSVQTWQVTNNPSTDLSNNLVSYKRVGGVYTLAGETYDAAGNVATAGAVKQVAGTSAVTGANMQITVKGSRTVLADGYNSKPAINTTVFIVKRGENNYVTYQGVANVPSMTSHTGTVSTAAIVENDVVRAMYVDASSNVNFSGTAADVIYLLRRNRVDGDQANGYYGVFTAVVNGAIDNEFKATPINAALNTLYTFSTYNERTGVTAIDTDTIGSTTDGTVKATYGAVNLGAAGGGFSYDSTTRVYWVNANKTQIYSYSIENVPTQTTDKVWYADRGGLLTLLVIEEGGAGSGSGNGSGSGSGTTITSGVSGATSTDLDILKYQMQVGSVYKFTDDTLKSGFTSAGDTENLLFFPFDGEKDQAVTISISGEKGEYKETVAALSSSSRFVFYVDTGTTDGATAGTWTNKGDFAGAAGTAWPAGQYSWTIYVGGKDAAHGTFTLGS